MGITTMVTWSAHARAFEVELPARCISNRVRRTEGVVAQHCNCLTDHSSNSSRSRAGAKIPFKTELNGRKEEEREREREKEEGPKSVVRVLIFLSLFFATFPSGGSGGSARAAAVGTVCPSARPSLAGAKSRTVFRGAICRRVETRFRESGKTAWQPPARPLL